MGSDIFVDTNIFFRSLMIKAKNWGFFPKNSRRYASYFEKFTIFKQPIHCTESITKRLFKAKSCLHLKKQEFYIYKAASLMSFA